MPYNDVDKKCIIHGDVEYAENAARLRECDGVRSHALDW